MRRTPCSFKKPLSSSSMARFSPAWPPRVGSTLSGLSFMINCSTTSLSVMIVAGLEFNSTTSMPSSFRERQACVPA